MSHRSFRVWMTTAPLLIAAAAFVGCAPKGGAVKEEVVEIEEIEMAPDKPATEEPDRKSVV